MIVSDAVHIDEFLMSTIIEWTVRSVEDAVGGIIMNPCQIKALLSFKGDVAAMKRYLIEFPWMVLFICLILLPPHQRTVCIVLYLLPLYWENRQNFY